MTDQPLLDPQRTALLVMDYQVGLLQRLPQADELIERVNTTIADVRAHGGHVGWVRVAFTEEDFAAIPAHSVMARQAASPEVRDFMHADAPTTQLHEALARRPEDASVRKTRIGAFTTTDLGRRLEDRGVDTLVLAGISTSGVVLSTVREAMDRDYRLLVLGDSCADPEQGTHDFLVERLYPRYATVLDAAELRQLWA